MDPAVLDQLEQTLRSEGPTAAIDRLCARLRQEKDYHALFYALLLKKRHELGVSPIPTGPAQDLPEAVHPAYEQAIREAARHVGGLYLEANDVPQAWAYFRMIEEPEPVCAALDKYQPGPEEDLQGLVHVAYYEGAHPRKGFDWILERYGICSAITTISSQELPHPEADRHYCIRALVRSLYAELRDRLTAEIEAREGRRPAAADAAPDTPGVVAGLIGGRDWLFADEAYHIDVSHLSSVVQMSTALPPCPELALARELCAYGRRLSGRFLQPGDPPFEDLFGSHARYLAILAGEVEGNLAYFRDQADQADPETVGTYPAEVLVNLLLRLDRPADALAVARKHLARPSERRLSCPGVTELCQKLADYRTLAEVAREQGDAIHFLAGLLGRPKRRGEPGP
jgi:hypothetical protein